MALLIGEERESLASAEDWELARADLWRGALIEHVTAVDRERVSEGGHNRPLMRNNFFLRV